ncbi:hypothetical protein CCACVL1_13003 [Corchorus capsularis]|uniref:Large ribosomal subunit protein uL30-like ferredoxin-like fold domain-containing protein n=1 Tax=Corchorus capsularis TaxID=210143 RepID=A0A1R3ICT2_COCAP|nr:hypothetical protein CCACVL1_13003 [Corchorus capsularis]
MQRSIEAQEKELIQLKREAKLNGGFYVDPEAKLLFSRIRGIHAVHPRTRKILQLLCLRQVFVLRTHGVSHFNADFQWSFSKGEQGNNEYASSGRTICYLWVSQSEECVRADL